MPLTDDYLAALEPLARAFEAYARASDHTPVLVGGAAVSIFTCGQFPSGDFDVVAARDDAFDAAMLGEGFVREDRPGRLQVGFYHPGHPAFGYQQVSGPLFDGRADRARLVRLSLDSGSSLVLPAVEDMIADRLGQYGAAPLTDTSRLNQARALFDLAGELDVPYLRKRIADENGDPALLGL